MGDWFSKFLNRDSSVLDDESSFSLIESAKPQVLKIKPVSRRTPAKTVTHYTPPAEGCDAPRERKVILRPEFSVKGTVSMRVVHEKRRCRGYPTLFRPELSAVTGPARDSSRSNPLMLIAVSLVTLLVANSSPMDKLVQILQSERATAQASTWIPDRKAPALFSPLFGPAAIDECKDNCRLRPEREVSSCALSCEKLSLSSFAKPQVGARSQDEDAKGIIESCLHTTFEKLRAAEGSDWQSDLANYRVTLDRIAGEKSVGDFARARLQLKQLQYVISHLKFPPMPNEQNRQEELAEKLLRASCLRAHISLSEIGRLLSHQNADDGSEQYYTGLLALIRQPALKLEAELKKDSRPAKKTG